MPLRTEFTSAAARCQHGADKVPDRPGVICWPERHTKGLSYRLVNSAKIVLRLKQRDRCAPCPPDQKGQKRPTGVIGNALRAAQMATGGIDAEGGWNGCDVA